MRKAISILSASAIAIGTCLPAGLAFADPDPQGPPNVGEQSGAGSTALTMVWDNPDTEYMGYGEDGTNNPDTSPQDDLGDNLAFKAPTAINFVAKASGDLIAPSYSAVYIENFSNFGIHVSSMRIEQGTGWNIVENATAAASTSNAVWGKIGPYNEQLNWYDHKTKADVTTASKWGMAATGAAGNQSKLFLATEGKFSNLDKDLSSAQTFGTIHWYLKMGGEGQRAADPATVHTMNKPSSAPDGGLFSLKTSLAPASASENLDDAVAGDTVYIVAEPESGCAVDEMEVTTTDDGENVSVTRNVGGDANVGSFVMPDEDVDVSVTFESVPPLTVYTMSQLQTVSNDIRANGAASEYYEEFRGYAEAGETTTVHLGDGTTSQGDTTAILVDVKEGYGLVFMLYKIRSMPIHNATTNSGGWASSNLRTNLQSGGYVNTTYLSGMTMETGDAVAQAVSPVPVTTSSYRYNTTAITSTDTYWIPSLEEIYGNWSFSSVNGSDSEDCTQFAYFAALGVTKNKTDALDYNKNGFTKTAGGGDVIGTRSASTRSSSDYLHVEWNGGKIADQNAAYTNVGILPCFCL